MRTILLLILTLALGAGEAPLGHKDFLPSPEHPVGWRGDGSGAFPGATPVTIWSEGAEVKDAVKLKTGKDATGWNLKPGTPSKNIAWKTEMPSWSNSSPIVVGDRAFCMAEPHTLVCVDMQTGTIRWQHDNNPLELGGMPAAEAAKRQVLFDAARAVQIIWRRFNGTGGASRTMAKQNETPEGKEIIRTAIADLERLKGTLAAVDKAVAEAALDPLIAKAKTALDKGGSAGDPDAIGQALSRAFGLHSIESWMGLVGWTFATPVSDGQRVYVTIGQGQVAAYDLDGKRLWGTCFKPKEGTHRRMRVPHVPSPLLADGVLVAQGADTLRGLDAATGKLLWTAEETAAGGYRCGSYRLVQVAGVGRVVVATSGRIWRLKDGKALGDLGVAVCGSEAGGTSVVGQDDLVVFFTGSNGGGPTVCFRLKAAGADAVTGEKVWEFAGKNGGSTRIVHQGLLYNYLGTFQILDLATGKEVGKIPSDKAFNLDDWSSSIIAGSTFIGVGQNPGKYDRNRVDDLIVVGFPTADVSDPRAFKVISGTNLLGGLNKPRFPEMEQLLPQAYAANDWSHYSLPAQFGEASPFAAGNRVLIRSLSHLYCIGDPAVPYDGKAVGR